MSTPTDNRMLDAPPLPVHCGTCAARVEVRKASWEQTTIQWSRDTANACVERRAARPGAGPNGATFRGCAALRDAIAEAAVRGDLPVQEDLP